MRFGDQIAIFAESAEVRIHSVKIDGAVAVITFRRAVFDDGREPQRGDAEFLKIKKMFAKAAQIAAVIGAGLGAVERRSRFFFIARVGICRALLWFVVARIAVGEAVRHDEVQNVLRIEPLEFAESGGARGDRQIEGSFAGGRADAANGGAGAGFGSDLQPDKKIVAAGAGLRSRNVQRGKIAGYAGSFQVV